MNREEEPAAVGSSGEEVAEPESATAMNFQQDVLSEGEESPREPPDSSIEELLPQDSAEFESDSVEEAQGERDERLNAAMEGWTAALRDIQRSIDEAATAIRFLRETLAQMAPVWRSLGGLEESLTGFGEGASRPEKPRLRAVDRRYEDETATTKPAVEDASTAPIEAIAEVEEEAVAGAWQSWKRKPQGRERAAPRQGEREEPESEIVSLGPRPQAMKPVTLVPDDTPAAYSYRLSVEDTKRPLELVPLYQALNSVPAIKNLSLLGYVNGVASLSIEATDEVKPEEIETAVGKVMRRSCSVVPHESNTILVQVGV